MTFEEWWKKNGKDFSPYCIPDEIKWFAEQAWDAAVRTMMNQEREGQANKPVETTAEVKPFECNCLDKQTHAITGCPWLK